MAVTAPTILEPEALYNLLMKEIEPELTSDHISLLEAKYDSESEEERQKRIDRYNAAFEAYDRALDQYLSELHRTVDIYRRQAIGEAEQESRTDDQDQLSHIETIFASH